MKLIGLFIKDSNIRSFVDDPNFGLTKSSSNLRQKYRRNACQTEGQNKKQN